MPPSHCILYIVTKEIARWIVSCIIGISITIWATILAVVLSPSILQDSLKSVGVVFLFSSFLTSLSSYLVFFTRGRGWWLKI